MGLEASDGPFAGEEEVLARQPITARIRILKHSEWKICGRQRIVEKVSFL